MKIIAAMDNSFSDLKALLIPLLLALLVHLLFAFYVREIPLFLTPSLQKQPHIIMLADSKLNHLVPSPELPRLRTVGIKNGKKEFSSKMDPLPVQGQPQVSKTTLKDLQLQPNKDQLKSFTKSKEALRFKSPLEDLNSSSGPALSREELLKQHQIQQAMIRQNSMITPGHPLKSSLLNLAFEAPEGVSEDELNPQ